MCKHNLPRACDGKLAYYSDLGGYPIFYLDAENSCMCTACARQSDNEDEIPQFRPVAYAVNYEDDFLFCDQCGTRIEPAYSEES